MASRAAKRFVDLSGKMTKLLHLILILRLALGLCWWMIHLVFSVYTFGPRLLQFIESYIISTGLLERYKNLQLHKLRYLAVVVDSKEARYTQKIKKLLCWLSDIGVNYLILYDMEGVLKESLKEDLSDIFKGMTSVPRQDQMTIELLSFADSKEGVAKAASFWYTKHMKDELESYERKDPNITETDMSSALEAVGCGGPEPDLLLVYGPVRCHIGFPAWRMRYTEIFHMGPLKSMKYGAIVKALHEFTKKQQNYGT